MVSQPIWIGIVIVVFFVGIGVSYAHFANTYDPMSMKFQNQGLFDQMMSNNPRMSQQWMDSGVMNQQSMQQMMQDPTFRNEMMEFMIQDTDHMNQWMKDEPQHVPLMIEKMKVNHDFMMGMVVPMVQDPGLRLQLLGHMTESPEAMAQMQQMIGGGMMDDEAADHDEAAGHDEATMGMPAPPQNYIVSLAEGSGVPGCEITDECYLPYSLDIWVSDTVSWNNVDSAAHTVTSGSPNNHDGNFDSGMMMVNQSWEFTFTDSGEYDYYCVLHPWMTGKIIVNEVEEMIVIP